MANDKKSTLSEPAKAKGQEAKPSETKGEPSYRSTYSYDFMSSAAPQSKEMPTTSSFTGFVPPKKPNWGVEHTQAAINEFESMVSLTFV